VGVRAAGFPGSGSGFAVFLIHADGLRPASGGGWTRIPPRALVKDRMLSQAECERPVTGSTKRNKYFHRVHRREWAERRDILSRHGCRLHWSRRQPAQPGWLAGGHICGRSGTTCQTGALDWLLFALLHCTGGVRRTAAVFERRGGAGNGPEPARAAGRAAGNRARVWTRPDCGHRERAADARSGCAALWRSGAQRVRSRDSAPAAGAARICAGAALRDCAGGAQSPQRRYHATIIGVFVSECA
jgi:hypothetical protein